MRIILTPFNLFRKLWRRCRKIVQAYQGRSTIIEVSFLVWPVALLLASIISLVLNLNNLQIYLRSYKVIAVVDRIHDEYPFRTVYLNLKLEGKNHVHSYRYKSSNPKEKMWQEIPVRIIQSGDNISVYLPDFYHMGAFLLFWAGLVGGFLPKVVKDYFLKIYKDRHVKTRLP